MKRLLAIFSGWRKPAPLPPSIRVGSIVYEAGVRAQAWERDFVARLHHRELRSLLLYFEDAMIFDGAHGRLWAIAIGQAAKRYSSQQA